MTQPKKNILILGGSGFIAERIGEYLTAAGFSIRVLSRRPDLIEGTLAFPATVCGWDGESIPEAAIRDCFGVINLAGESIADGRWNVQKKARIMDSRVSATSALAKSLISMTEPPAVIIQGSAIGYYGSASLERKNETDDFGEDFLADVCRKWESICAEFPAGIRRVIMRTGMVLGWSGGALPELSAIYASGLGAVLGSGKQWINWIHIDDVAAFVLEALANENFRGAFNLVAPENIRNQELHKKLCQYYPIRSPVPVPALLLRAGLGEKSTIVLNGPQVIPEKLLAIGFNFSFPRIELALTNLYGKREYPGDFILQFKQFVPMQVGEIWPFFASEKNLEKLTPPWLAFHVLGKSSEQIDDGTILFYKLKLHGLSFKWKSEIIEWNPGVEFVDRQLQGPYKIWHHRHIFRVMESGTQIVEIIQFKLPLRPFSLPANRFVMNDVRKIFSYRQQVVKQLFCRTSTPRSIGATR